jgi:hypothetical protein
MSKAMITEAEFFRDAFQAHDEGWIIGVMEQFSPRLNCGYTGWLWSFRDGSNLRMLKGKLFAEPNLEMWR